MSASSWKKPMLSALAVSIFAMGGTAHAAGAWRDGTPRTAYTTMFEWSWDSIAKECTNYLGPKGYAAVQVSPPNEHIGNALWWARYQPVSYELNSRSGNREQFKNMVETCKKAGVDIYVDTVINHMQADRFDFPKVPYGPNDFNQRCIINDKRDYNSPDQGGSRNNVTQCAMVGLADLNTGSGYVQDKIAGYMNDLRSLGVAGFRIDAAKHIRPGELAAIKAKVPGNYFFTQEVIPDGNVGGDWDRYVGMGTLNEFKYIYLMKEKLKRTKGGLADIPEAFKSWGFLPSDKATVFVNNHDTERKLCSDGGNKNCDSMNSHDGEAFYLAQIFMLGYPYGYPSVASGFHTWTHDEPPPSVQPYNGSETKPANCSRTPEHNKWDCTHRDRGVGNMVGFRNYTAGTGVDDWKAEGQHRVSFRRGNKGFLAVNNDDGHWQTTVYTGLPDGKYCNIMLADEPEKGICPEGQVTVSNGSATISVPPRSAFAIHVGAKPGNDPQDPDDPDEPDDPDPKDPTCTEAFCPSLSPVDSNPAKASIKAGGSVTLYYKGQLANSSAVKVHWGINKWTGVSQTAMTKAADGYWKVTLSIPASATELDFVFTDGSRWDNNGGADWKWPVSATQDPKDPDDPKDPGGAVTITFKVKANTRWGESVYITGDQQALGNWSTSQDASRKCDPSSYPTWTCKITFPKGGTAIKYKFTKLGLGTTWENGQDRTYTLPTSSQTKDDGSFR